MLIAERANETRTALEHAALAAEIAAYWARSVAIVLDEALAALKDIERATGVVISPPGVSPRRTDALSAREREVLALVVQGRSNKAIAEALYVSPNTVKTHVASLLRKLRADTRTQLAAMAVRQEWPLGHNTKEFRLHQGERP